MQIDLTSEEISIINDGLLTICLEIGKNKQNKFIDLQRLVKYEDDVTALLKKINLESEKKYEVDNKTIKKY